MKGLLAIPLFLAVLPTTTTAQSSAAPVLNEARFEQVALPTATCWLSWALCRAD